MALLDAWPTANAYTDNTAISIGYAVQNSVALQKCANYWCRIGTSQILNSSLAIGTTSSVVAIGSNNITTNCSNVWGQATQSAGQNNLGTGDCQKSSNSAVWYSTSCGFGDLYTANNYCSSKGMRVPSRSEIAYGMPFCGSATITSTQFINGFNYFWNGSSANSAGSIEDSYSIRCVQ